MFSMVGAQAPYPLSVSACSVSTGPCVFSKKADIFRNSKFFSHRCRIRARSFAPDVAQRMLEYDWPGNVRELQSFVETAILRAPRDAELIQAGDLTF